MVRRRTLLTAAGGTLLGAALATGTARADSTVTVNPGTSYGNWEGWGTSLAWWANLYGGRDDFADLFFTTKSVAYNGTSLPGLGLNIARYNLGGCGTRSYDGASMVASPNIPSYKQIPGYWLDWAATDPASSSWDWGQDATQRAMLVKAAQRGAVSELFSNSPMWWMCTNHNPSGASGGGNNLQSWNYQQHAVYLATVAAYARNNWGVAFSSVEAFNEPSSNWWTATGTQEGCHVDASVQATVLGYLRGELDARGLTGTLVSASDENTYDLARTTWGSFGSATRQAVGRVNVHGYQGSGGRRDLLYSDVVTSAGKKLWNSEYGDGDATGYTLATNLCLDFRWLHPTAWVYWQVMDPSTGWALIPYDPSSRQTGAPQNKFYVLAQFTRHIRPGMRLLDTAAANAAVAYDASAHRLVIAAVNTGAAQQITFDLSAFGTVTGGSGGLVPRWSTSTQSGSDRYTAYSDTHVSGKRFTASFAAGTVQTFQIDGVTV